MLIHKIVAVRARIVVMNRAIVELRFSTVTFALRL